MQNLMSQTMAIILAGGSGTRLKSLTRWHSKPAVPFGGKYKTIDFPLSNCINSHIRKIFILTQYKSHSLNSHIQHGWNFLPAELGEFIDCIPAQQRVTDNWYQGTADAVFQNIDIFQELDPKYILVLAGDHIYKMNYADMLQHHIDTGSDMTVGCIEVPKADAKGFGVMSVDKNHVIKEFCEKPKSPKTIPGKPDMALASMGIYIFNADFLYDLLEKDHIKANSSHDFGKDIIPATINSHHLTAYPFRDKATGQPGYWRDVGTIDSYYEANIALCDVTPELNLYDKEWRIWSYQEQLPPAKFVFDDEDRRGMAVDSIVSAGCILSGSYVNRSVIFNNVKIECYSDVSNSIVMNDSLIGRNCKIRNTIIDRRCVVPDGMIIGYDKARDAERFYVSPGGVTLVSAEMLENLMKFPQKELVDVA